MSAIRFPALAATLTVLVGAAGALASTSASAHQVYDAPVAVVHGQPAYRRAPEVIVADGPIAYGQAAPHRYDAQAGAGCSVQAWDPRVRYMPGQVVWQAGNLWVARGVSARVWNENSPPEWTPQYWRQAVCQ